MAEGSNVNLTLPISNNAARKLCQLTDSGASFLRQIILVDDLTTSSGLFVFLLTNVSADDAGYYAIGHDVISCRTNHGVVLVVNGEYTYFVWSITCPVCLVNNS